MVPMPSSKLIMYATAPCLPIHYPATHMSKSGSQSMVAYQDGIAGTDI